MLWTEEQRAVGERMIEETGGGSRCVGYAGYLDRAERVDPLLARVSRDLKAGEAEFSGRLVEVHTLLVQMVRELDPDETRYDHARMKQVVAKPRRIARAERGSLSAVRRRVRARLSRTAVGS